MLILGPTGSGKEVVARMIHELSRRTVAKFQAVNCAALPDTLFESEIFGYGRRLHGRSRSEARPPRISAQRGHALPRRDRRHVAHRPGEAPARPRGTAVRAPRRQHVHRGELPPHLGDQPAARTVCHATARVPARICIYRVNAFAIRLPSLRERQVDIRCSHSASSRYCAAQGLPLDSKSFSPQAIDLLLGYHWPGNIRELESTVSRAALSAPGRSIRPTDIEFLHAIAATPQASGDRLPSLAESERAHIVRVLEAVEWNKKEAARVLDISRGTLVLARSWIPTRAGTASGRQAHARAVSVPHLESRLRHALRKAPAGFAV